MDFRILATAAAVVLCCAGGVTTQAQQLAPNPAPGRAQALNGQNASVAPAGAASGGGEWVKPSGPRSGAFPEMPQTGASASSTASAFPATTYGTAAYGGASNQAQRSSQTPRPHDGVAPLAPLDPPPSDFQRASAQVSPLSNNEIEQLRELFDSSRKAKAYRPVRTSPRIRTASVDLAPGSSLPILRTLPGESSTVVFVDATGAPWPIAAAPRVSRENVAAVEWLKDSPSVVVDMLSPYEEANMTVFLTGLVTPVVVKLSAGEPDGDDTHREKNGLKTPTTREVDYRLDLRVPGHSPWARQAAAGTSKIALYDDVLQAFLDGIPPQNAVRVTVIGPAPAKTEVWQFDDAMYVRTTDDIQSAFDNTLAASDGTRVYRLPPTPFITLSDAGRSVTFQVDLH